MRKKLVAALLAAAVATGTVAVPVCSRGRKGHQHLFLE